MSFIDDISFLSNEMLDGEFIENNRDDVKQDHLRLWFIINSLGSISASIPRVLHKIVECGLFTVTNSTRPVNRS